MCSPKQSLVCVIEDDADVRASFGLLLDVAGHDVRHYGSAEAFLRDPENIRADCLVLDLQMSGMSGLDLLQTIRADGRRIPAIVVSSNGKDMEAQCLAAGAVGVLGKPPDASRLLALVALALASSEKPPPP